MLKATGAVSETMIKAGLQSSIDQYATSIKLFCREFERLEFGTGQDVARKPIGVRDSRGAGPVRRRRATSGGYGG